MQPEPIITPPATTPPVIPAVTIPWWKTTRARVIAAVVAVASFLTFSYAYSVAHPDTPPPTKPPTTTPTPVKPSAATASTAPAAAAPSAAPAVAKPTPAPAPAPKQPKLFVSGDDQLTAKSQGTCTALAPASWTIHSTAPPLSALCYLYASGNLFAGRFVNTTNYGIAYDTAQALGDDSLSGIYNPSDTSAAILAYVHLVLANPDAGTVAADHSTVNWTDDYNQAVGDYTLRSFASDSYQGVVFYRTDQVSAGDGASFIEFYNMAFTPKGSWATEGLKAARIASDIQVSVVFTPQKQDFSSSDLPKGSKSGTKDSAGNDVTDDGYNVQLGTEEVHSAATGTNYLVNPSTDWSSDGPNGAGYYIKNGNDVTKLEAGRVD